MGGELGRGPEKKKENDSCPNLEAVNHQKRPKSQLQKSERGAKGPCSESPSWKVIHLRLRRRKGKKDE